MKHMGEAMVVLGILCVFKGYMEGPSLRIIASALKITGILNGIDNIEVQGEIVNKLCKIVIWWRENDVTKKAAQKVVLNGF